MAGNPNVGKSLVFTNLTKRYVEVSNYPGTTVDISRGLWQGNPVTDTPGVYALNGSNDEERLTEALLSDADVIINVVDGTSLRRDLYLTLQLSARGVPMVVLVNMMDEVRRQQLQLDLARLETLLGVPVVAGAAATGEGMAELGQVVKTIGPGKRQRLRDQDGDMLRRRANEIYQAIAAFQGKPQLSPLDKWLTRPLSGLFTAALVMAFIWWAVGRLVAGEVVDFTEGVVFKRWLLPPLVTILQKVLPQGLLQHVLVGEFGIFTMAVAYGIGLLLPLVFSFYLLLSLLEDSGYLPRLAVLLDNTFRPLGLNGKAVIPLILGFGCVTMAVISTRMLTTKRERIILAFLLGLAVPCSAQTGVIAMMLATMGYGWLVLYGLLLMVIFVMAGVILNKTMPGRSDGLFLELPRLRLPRPRNILSKSWAKSKAFLKDALPLFVLSACLITLLDYWGGLAAMEKLAAPVTEAWLKLPATVVRAFIMGLIRRDFGAAGLLTINLSAGQRFVALMTMTLFVPCIASVLVIIKEHGLLMGIAVTLTSLAVALLAGGLLAAII
ncbi:MAG TPA: ferrous iron transporter B [Bacillota bacterium]|nr:ferrous iron transporter B [Bacillota bacterium]HQD19398.1 ferrous iron transporter B [Bacillota bacterium]